MSNEQLAAVVAQEVYQLLGPVLEQLGDRVRPAPEYVTLHDAARVTSFSYDFVYDAVRKGELPAVKKGRDWRVALADLRHWMDKDRGKASLPPRSELSDLERLHLPRLSG